MRVIGIFGLAGLAVALLTAQERPAPGNDSIRAADLEADVRFLASDELSGRRTDTEGNRRAAEYISDRFADHGLDAVGSDDSYFHRFDLITTTLGEDNRVAVDGWENDLRLGDDFYPDPVSASATGAGPVTFIGYGIDAPALDHDDYRDADLASRVALLIDHEPGEFDRDSRFEGEAASEDARIVRKVLAAQRRGAVAVLVAPDVHNHTGQQGFTRSMTRVWPASSGRVTRYDLASWLRQVEIPVMQISIGLAERLASASGQSLRALSVTAERAGGVAPVDLDGSVVELTSRVQRQTVPNRNVVGLVEGTDRSLRGEWVVLSAHYDHEGTVNEQIYNGADDDASGVAGLIEIAEAYAIAARAGFRPKRSILFAAWNSEEQGLLGAWAYTQEPLHPLDQTVAVLNMDMIGRDEEIPAGGGARFRGLMPQTAESNRNALNLLGYSRSPDLRRAAVRANDAIDLDLRFRYDDNRSNLLRRSDQWPFLYRGVPALFVHTGLHPDYHTERDRPETLNYRKMARVVQLVHQLSWDLAQATDRPVYSSP